MAARFVVVPAAHVHLLRGDEVLLQRRCGTGYLDGHWVAAAAGHIEHGETAARAVIREAEEELGVRIEERDLEPATLMQRTDGTPDPVQQRADWYFTATAWIGSPQVREPEKCDAMAWFPLAALPSPLPSYEATVLGGIASGRLPLFTSDGF